MDTENNVRCLKQLKRGVHLKRGRGLPQIFYDLIFLFVGEFNNDNENRNNTSLKLGDRI